jgi:hypothetical protein
MTRLLFFLGSSLVALVSCGAPTPAENKADQLENAAEQSTPAAADVLENAAEVLEEGNLSDPEAAAENALNQAANAQTQESE